MVGVSRRRALPLLDEADKDHARKVIPQLFLSWIHLHFSPCGEAEVRAHHESGPFRFTGRQTFLLGRTMPPPMVFTKHETRNTNHGIYAFH